MSEDQDNPQNQADQEEERPCLHCLIIEVVDDFFAEYPAAKGEPDTIDTDEVIIAIAKTVAELTSSQDGAVRQTIIAQLTREIMNYDAARKAEFMRSCRRNINNPTFGEWSAIVDAYYDCLSVFQIGDANECSER